MSKQRRTFSAEFKREAAALVLDQGYSHIDACRSLGVVDSALRRWVKQLEAERQGVTPKSKALTPEQQKIQELEARINRLEREKAILKKVLRGLWGKSELTVREAGKLAVAKHTLHLSLLSPCILLILPRSGQAMTPLPAVHPPTTPF
ncbi:transposase [Pseudomonas aeruginosa BWH057]|nr:transposase [Pseudomonas aeruginosa BWH057]EZO84619.1 transposase [Pseudomonas aeruginosa BWH056]